VIEPPPREVTEDVAQLIGRGLQSETPLLRVRLEYADDGFATQHCAQQLAHAVGRPKITVRDEKDGESRLVDVLHATAELKIVHILRAVRACGCVSAQCRAASDVAAGRLGAVCARTRKTSRPGHMTFKRSLAMRIWLAPVVQQCDRKIWKTRGCDNVIGIAYDLLLT
jgi:hypothetical protein